MLRDYRHVSFWHDSLPGLLLPRPPLNSEILADVVIIGAGYTGLWTAYYLKQIKPALRVVILEAEIAGYGASGRNGGWCSSHLLGLDSWLDDPASRAGAIRLQTHMFETVRDIGRVVQSESIDCHFEQSGALDVAVLPIQKKRLMAELQRQRTLGFGEEDYRWLDSSELRSHANIDKAMGAVWLSHCAAIHPARLARGLADVVERKGVIIHEHSPVVSIAGDTVSTAEGKVRAGTILLTTEGYSAGLAGSRQRLIPVHSMMVATEPLSPAQLQATGLTRRYAFGNGDRVVTYGQLTNDRRIAFGCRGTYLYGSGIQRSFDAASAEFEHVRQTLLRFFPDLKGIRFTHAWGGAMGVSRALHASVNYDAERRFGWAGGYLGSGVAATHLAAQTLADLVTGRETERLDTPWVNPVGARRSWEPEPLRWLGIRFARSLMNLADRAEYRGGNAGAILGETLDHLRPGL